MLVCFRLLFGLWLSGRGCDLTASVCWIGWCWACAGCEGAVLVGLRVRPVLRCCSVVFSTLRNGSPQLCCVYCCVRCVLWGVLVVLFCCVSCVCYLDLWGIVVVSESGSN